MTIAQLKALQLDRLDIEDMVALSSFATVLQTEFEAHELMTPEWLTDAQKRLESDIRAKSRDQLEAELKKAKLRQESLKTATEQRADNAKRIAELEKRLA